MLKEQRLANILGRPHAHRAVCLNVSAALTSCLSGRAPALRTFKYLCEQQILGEHVHHLTARMVTKPLPQRSRAVSPGHADVNDRLTVENDIYAWCFGDES
jgi:hypothetical protein